MPHRRHRNCGDYRNKQMKISPPTKNKSKHCFPLSMGSKAFPPVGLAILLLPLQLLVSFAVDMPIYVLKSQNLIGSNSVLDLFQDLWAFVITLWIIQLWSKRPWLNLLALRRVGLNIWWPILVSILGLYFLMGYTAVLVEIIFPVRGWFAGFLLNMDFLALVISAPLTEEILDRGVILGGFLERYGRIKAILLSASIFALGHLNPWQLIPAFIFAIFVGWVFAMSRSIWPGLAMHIANNWLCYMDQHFWASPFNSHQHLPPIWIFGLGLLLVAWGIWQLNHIF